MIWFDIKELERSLKTDNVSDKVVFYYLLVTLLIFTVAPYFTTLEHESKWMLTGEIILSLAITIFGTKMTFDINSSGDNKDYFRRFLSLSFVTAVRLLVFSIILAIPVAIVWAFLEDMIVTNQVVKQVLDLGLLLAVGLFYYYMLVNSFKRVSGKSGEN